MNRSCPTIAVIGGGPAGLMAAETLAQAGLQVDVYDAMPSVGRKFLLAGRGGMNITHAEPLADFLTRYGDRAERIAPWLEVFGPRQVREWIHALGIETFVGSSRRVFPQEMKAAPLLRAWLRRLRASGIRIHSQHRWSGWSGQAGRQMLRFATPQGERLVEPDATILALGGASWARMGSDGQWQELLRAQGVRVAPLRPANCGFLVEWSEHFRTRFAGAPLKNVAASHIDAQGGGQPRMGELMVSASGIEGSLVYALAAPLRDAIARHGSATLRLDLLPAIDAPRLIEEIAHPRGSRSMASHLQSRIGLTGVKAGLLREYLPPEAYREPQRLAGAIKALDVTLHATYPIERAISSAGGVAFDELSAGLMLQRLPGVFCVGEMLDWEAPTGGYLLTACLASGVIAGRAVVDWIGNAAPHAA